MLFNSSSYPVRPLVFSLKAKLSSLLLSLVYKSNYCRLLLLCLVPVHPRRHIFAGDLTNYGNVKVRVSFDVFFNDDMSSALHASGEPYIQ